MWEIGEDKNTPTNGRMDGPAPRLSPAFLPRKPAVTLVVLGLEVAERGGPLGSRTNTTIIIG